MDRNIDLRFGKATYNLKDNQIIVYSKLPSKSKEKVELYRYPFIPILSDELKEKLLAQFDYAPILKDFIIKIEKMYVVQQNDLCMKNYFERLLSNGSYNKKRFLEQEINIVEKRKVDSNIYPIFTQIDEASLKNENLYLHLYNLMVQQKLLKIDNVTDLIFEGLNTTPNVINLKPFRPFKEVNNSIIRIIYIRFLDYLHEELNRCINQQKENQEEKRNHFKGNKDIEPFYIKSEEKLLDLYNCLLNNKPPLIKENQFFVDSFKFESVNLLHKTEWLVEQTQLFYLIYLLNGKKEYYNKNHITTTAFSLFTFPKLKKTNIHTTQVNYKKFIPRITTPQYLASKQKKITTIYYSVFPQVS